MTTTGRRAGPWRDRARDADPREALERARRVLIVRTDGLGDNVIASGLPSALAARLSAVCGLVANPPALELVDTTGLHFVRAVETKPVRSRDVWTAGTALAGALRQFRPDVVVLPRFDFEREALALALASTPPPTVITWSRRTTRRRSWRNCWLELLPGPRYHADRPPAHERDRFAAFGQWLGLSARELAPRLVVDPVDGVLLAPDGAGGGGFAAIAIGALHPRRQWPADRFARLADQLAEMDLVPVLVGSPSEAPDAQAVVSAAERRGAVVNLVGRLPLRQVAGVIARSELMVGNDSGLGHVAGALGTPNVVVSCHPAGADPTYFNAPERYRPWGSSGQVVRPARPSTPACADHCRSASAPCCITEVSVAEVVRACAALLGDRR